MNEMSTASEVFGRSRVAPNQFQFQIFTFIYCHHQHAFIPKSWTPQTLPWIRKTKVTEQGLPVGTRLLASTDVG